jgi:PASTA domain-containing protein
MVVEEESWAIDDQTGKVFKLAKEKPWDIAAATVSVLYLMVMLVFYSWQLLDIGFGKNILLKIIFTNNADSLNTALYRIIAFTVIGGGLGGTVNGIRGFIVWHSERKGFGWRFIWKYITFPLLGAILAGIVYAIVRGGVAAFGGNFTPNQDLTNQTLAAFGIGALSGYGSHKVFRWLDSIVNRMFKIAKTSDVLVPDLIGMTKDNAELFLKEFNLKLGHVVHKDTVGPTEEDKVVAQNPTPGSSAPKDGKVGITIGRKKAS